MSRKALLYTKRGLNAVPEEVWENLDLEFLDLRGNPIGELPSEIGRLKNLKNLYLENCNLTKLPPEIGALTNLRVLNIRRNKLRELPNELSKLERLGTLDADYNKLSKLPDDIGNMQKLRVLRLVDNPIEELPESLARLSKLQELYINKPAFKEFPLAFMGLESIQQSKKFVNTTNFSQFHSSREVAELRKVVKACGDAKLSLATRKIAYALLFDKWEKLQGWTVYPFLQFLKVKNIMLSSHATRFLTKKYAKSALEEGSELLILGEATKWKSQRALKARIVEEGVSCVSEIRASTTHVLLGANLEKPLEKSDFWENVTYINQAQLKDFLESKEDLFLKDSSLSDEEIENIRLLLSNPSEENVQLAIQLLRAGGIPKPIFTDLFAAHVVQQNKKIRKSIRKLLRPFMDGNDLKALLSCGQYSQKMDSLEHYLANSSCFDAYEIVLWLFKERGRGANFLLNKTTEEQAKAFVKMKLKKGRFLNFQECKDLKDLPDVLRCFPEIEKINLSKTGFIEVPKVLLKYDFPNLKKVDMRHSAISYLTIKVRKLERAQFEAKYPDCKLIF